MDHLSTAQVQALCRKDLDPEELLEIDRHLETCPECRGLWAAARPQVTPEFSTYEPADHLTYEQIKALVDHTLDPAASVQVDRHLRACPSCRAEADDLRRFAAMLHQHDSAPQPASLGARLAAWFRSAPILKTAAALALLLLAVVITARVGLLPERISALFASSETITDGARTYRLNARGDIQGWDDLPESHRRAIHSALSNGARTGAIIPADAGSHLLSGIAAWEAGRNADARREFEALKAANPQSKVVDRLLSIAPEK